MNHTVWYVYEVFARFLYVLVCFHTSTYTTICIWEKSKRRPSNLLTFTRSATHVLRCVPSRLTMNHWLGPCFLNPSDAPVRLAQEQQRPELSLKRCLAARDFEKTDGRIWVFPKIVGFPSKWMVKIMENPIYQNGWFGGEHPLFSETSILLWKCYYNGRHDMTEDGSVVQPRGPKKLKHYTESQSTCLVVN